MRYLLQLFIFWNLLTIQSASGQTNCIFPIDTVRILGNKNLDSFLQDLKTDSFKITNDKKDIPEFIQRQLDCYANGFSIANPDQPYQSTDVIITEGLPWRQLTFLAKSSTFLIMRYNIGGIGVSSHVVLIRFNKDKITDLWKGGWSSEIKNINDVVKYLERYRDKNIRRYDDYINF
jgi:hypothetical protein